MSDTGDRALDAQRETDRERELREQGTPEWHLAEAEEHLLEADVLASSGALGEATARLLAATANASIGALKLAIRQDTALYESTEHLRDISRHTENTAAELLEQRAPTRPRY